MVSSSHSLGHSFFFQLKFCSCFEMMVTFLRTHIWYLGIYYRSGLYFFFQAYFNMCWFCSWLFAPDFEVLTLKTNYKLLCYIEKTLCFDVCIGMHLSRDGWCLEISWMKCEEHIHEAKVDPCRYSELHNSSNCCAQSKRFTASSKNNSHTNRCSAISQLNCAPMKFTSTCPQAGVTISLHGLIEWKISFQSLLHSMATPHQSTSEL